MKSSNEIKRDELKKARTALIVEYANKKGELSNIEKSEMLKKILDNYEAAIAIEKVNTQEYFSLKSSEKKFREQHLEVLACIYQEYFELFLDDKTNKAQLKQDFKTAIENYLAALEAAGKTDKDEVIIDVKRALIGVTYSIKSDEEVSKTKEDVKPEPKNNPLPLSGEEEKNNLPKQPLISQKAGLVLGGAVLLGLSALLITLAVVSLFVPFLAALTPVFAVAGAAAFSVGAAATFGVGAGVGLAGGAAVVLGVKKSLDENRAAKTAETNRAAQGQLDPKKDPTIGEEYNTAPVSAQVSSFSSSSSSSSSLPNTRVATPAQSSALGNTSVVDLP